MIAEVSLNYYWSSLPQDKITESLGLVYIGHTY